MRRRLWKLLELGAYAWYLRLALPHRRAVGRVVRERTTADLRWLAARVRRPRLPHDPLAEERPLPGLTVPERVAVEDALRIMLNAIPAEAVGRADLESAAAKLGIGWFGPV